MAKKTAVYVSGPCSRGEHGNCAQTCEHCREWSCQCDCHMICERCGKPVKMIAYQPYCSQICKDG